MASGDSGGMGIVGVIVGVLIVAVLLFVFFGDRLGTGSPSKVDVKVEAPKVPTPKSN